MNADNMQPGLDDEIARILDQADVWDHVVALNTETLPRLMKHPQLKLLRYKGGAYEFRHDVDPVSLRALLAKPGQLVILEDPRLAVHELKRAPYLPVPWPPEVFARWTPSTGSGQAVGPNARVSPPGSMISMPPAFGSCLDPDLFPRFTPAKTV